MWTGRRIYQILLLLLSLLLFAYDALLSWASTIDDGDIGNSAECSDRNRLVGLGLIVLAGSAVALAASLGGEGTRSLRRVGNSAPVVLIVLLTVVGGALFVAGVRTACLPDFSYR